MSKRIFKDDAMQARFDREGFLVVPFIDADEVAYLNEVFDRLHPDLPQDGGFVSGSYSQDKAYKQQASAEVVKVFSKHYERLFVDYQPFGAAFLFKMPNQHSELAIHQDWTIVDEETSVALNCWVPLTDITPENGALHVLPGSQYGPVLKTVRCPTMGFFFSGNDDVAIAASEGMFVKAGEAVILNQSVVHYSPPNKSDKIRKAITAGVKSAGQPMTFHYNNPEHPNELEVFRMPEDFLISFENFYSDIMLRPKMGEAIGFKPYQQTAYNRTQVQQLVNDMRQKAGFAPINFEPAPQPISVEPKKKGILERLATVFR